MADVMKLNVITPEKQFYEGNVTMVELTTTEGEIGVYPNHIPLTAVVAPGVLKIHEEGEEKKASLVTGWRNGRMRLTLNVQKKRGCVRNGVWLQRSQGWMSCVRRWR